MWKDKDEEEILKKKEENERKNRLFSDDTIEIIASKTDEKLAME